MNNERLLTVGQAASLLGCCSETLRRYDRSGRFKADYRAPYPFDGRRLYRESSILTLRQSLYGQSQGENS
jgi:DNA-binding transcriptional MerR regulator